VYGLRNLHGEMPDQGDEASSAGSDCGLVLMKSARD
jgi:hypothetical protein